MLLKLTILGTFVLLCTVARAMKTITPVHPEDPCVAELIPVSQDSRYFTLKKFEDYLLNENGFARLDFLTQPENNHSPDLIFNRLARQAIQNTAHAYQSGVYSKLKKKVNIGKNLKEVFNRVYSYSLNAIETHTLNYLEYRALMDLILDYHDLVANAAEKQDAGTTDSEPRYNYINKMRVSELRKLTPALQKTIDKKLNNIDLLSHKVELGPKSFPLPIELDYYSFLIFGSDLLISGIPATPFVDYDAGRDSARAFNQHDDNHIHNLKFNLNYLADYAPNQIAHLHQILKFLRVYSKTISVEDRFFASIYLFYYYHEAAFQIDRLVDVFERKKFDEPQLDHVVTFFLKYELHKELEELSQTEIKVRIAAALRRIIAAYKAG